MSRNSVSIMVIGANGQLGSSFKLRGPAFPGIELILLSKKDLNITSSQTTIEGILANYEASYCINCAAYTKVDQAEEDIEEADDINAESALKIAQACSNLNLKLIHFSTDYVYKANSEKLYTEDDPTAPVGAYAKSKLKGESYIIDNNPNHIVIRTSWLYGPIGHNFIRTMLRLYKSGKSINVVNDQFGSPTYSIDLVDAILNICFECENDPKKKEYWKGIFNYSNQGVTNWYEVAKTVFELLNIECNLQEISTNEFGAKAKRPKWSAMSSQKIQSTFGLEINHWRTSLANCLYEWPTYFNI